MNTDTPETDALGYIPTDIAPAWPLVEHSRKLERERDHWRNEHDRVVREYQHRLMVIGTSVIEATSYPENTKLTDA